MQITVCARDSKLSKIQVQEVLQGLRIYYPKVHFVCHFLKTKGDKDQKTSLIGMEKTNFFTYELDQLVLQQICDVAIHSAKDLPEPIDSHLFIAAITKGVDPSDSLVLREGETLKTLPQGAKVGTSTERRKERIRALRSDLEVVDIRGNIEQRLQLLKSKNLDALIVAEAALIRLGLSPNRIQLPGLAAPYQGKLAVVCHRDNIEMQHMFREIHDGQKTSLLRT